MKKLLLVEPPYYRLYKDTYSNTKYPLGLGYLAKTVQDATDWDVRCLNLDFNPAEEGYSISHLAGAGYESYMRNLADPGASIWGEAAQAVRAERPDVVGISCKSQTFAPALRVARAVKGLDASIRVVMGGPHPTMDPDGVLRHPEVDAVVRGEGERTLTELLGRYGKGLGELGVEGVSHRVDGQTVHNPKRAFIEDLDSLGYPHLSAPSALMDFERYPKHAFRHIFATRGCPQACFFCGSRQIWSRKVRFRSPANVVGEIASLRSWGLDELFFDDDTFGVTPAHLKNLCEALIQHAPGIRWACEIHAQLVTPGSVDLMKRAGCFAAFVGVESGNDGILKLMGKNITTARARQACSLLKSSGIKVHPFFMVGLPWDTEETMADTFRLMREIDADLLIYSIFTPYPGSEAFDFLKEKGRMGDDFDVSLYNHQSPANNFCLNVAPGRFRQIAAEIEKYVDEHNSTHSFG
ncbi:MAG: B12-binding domain-containing radical SAM protein [Thermodesulfobacteriota bacterium]